MQQELPGDHLLAIVYIGELARNLSVSLATGDHVRNILLLHSYPKRLLALGSQLQDAVPKASLRVDFRPNLEPPHPAVHAAADGLPALHGHQHPAPVSGLQRSPSLQTGAIQRMPRGLRFQAY